MRADQTERREFEDGEVAVTATPRERQGVEVMAMRYVLGIGLALVILGMVATYVVTV
ncbi:hypothetical protein [Ancylobacter terrae]|uniref:hypothetical protein n=1 Tax=Ancylobacter sp. sgz301288 TaxID=3342077 RepID=UPI00385D5BFE